MNTQLTPEVRALLELVYISQTCPHDVATINVESIKYFGDFFSVRAWLGVYKDGAEEGPTYAIDNIQKAPGALVAVRAWLKERGYEAPELFPTGLVSPITEVIGEKEQPYDRRDRAAMHAMQGLLASDVSDTMSYEDVAEMSVKMADRLLAELNAKHGSELISMERIRQVVHEGFSQAKDAKYTLGELALAAVCYAYGSQVINEAKVWPFSDEWWKPSKDHVRNLEKAGALIAAEIDRILFERNQKGGAS